MKGWLTKKRYRVATVFVDNFSGMSYVHLQKTTNAEETLAAKKAFERYASRMGVKVLEYQADNGRFAEADFVSDAQKLGQSLKYCGVNAHFQNAVAERRIRLLQDQARTMLLHAKHRWRDAIETSLWPYALRVANEVHNSTPDITRTDGKSPISMFTSSDIMPNLDHFKPFGCPVYVLDNAMQSGKKISKWEIRSRMGVYLGMSSQHARSVALVLNLETGHVSPQFHVKFDSKFETIARKGGTAVPKSKWQKLCYFESDQQRERTKDTKKKGKDDEIPQAGSSKVRFPEGEGDFDRDAGSNELEVEVEGPELDGNRIGNGEVPAMDQPQGVNREDPPLAVDDGRRRSTRSTRARSRYDKEDWWVSMEAMLEDQLLYHVAFETCVEIGEGSGDNHPMLAYASSADPDTM